MVKQRRFCVGAMIVCSAAGLSVATEARAGFSAPALWAEDFGYYAGDWRMDEHVRVLADVDGDGKQDLVGFGDDGVLVAISTGTGFRAPALWTADFGASAGWEVERHLRMMADVDGDGLDDIIGFGDRGTYVARSSGAGFFPTELWVANYGYDAGEWRVDRHIRTLADVDGDGLPDVVAFGDFGVYVSRATGGRFTPPELWIEGFGAQAGYWDVERNPRLVADVDGDGRQDIVGFGNDGVYVSRSTGAGFTEADLWIDFFGQHAGDWRAWKHVRTLADVDGDGKQDVVGFGDLGVHVALSEGTGFRAPKLWVAAFGYLGGWRKTRDVRTLADVNGDGLADIVGFAREGALVSLATVGSFSWPQLWVEAFGSRAGDWRVDKHPRVLADVNGDGLADIVGFGDDGTFVSLAQP